MKELWLASNSPRRRQLLALGKIEFHAAGADVDESARAEESPGEYVSRLAEEKARALAPQTSGAAVLIGSDTTVVLEGALLGKPANPADAERMLKDLRGRTHQVYTGVAVFDAQNKTLSRELCVTDVPMRAYTDDEIAAYIQSGDPLDKAGGYAIQHPQFNPVASMRGCYAGVMGLPLCHLSRALSKAGVRFEADIARACQDFLQYKCPVAKEILKGQA